MKFFSPLRGSKKQEGRVAWRAGEGEIRRNSPTMASVPMSRLAGTDSVNEHPLRRVNPPDYPGNPSCDFGRLPGLIREAVQKSDEIFEHNEIIVIYYFIAGLIQSHSKQSSG